MTAFESRVLSIARPAPENNILFCATPKTGPLRRPPGGLLAGPPVGPIFGHIRRALGSNWRFLAMFHGCSTPLNLLFLIILWKRGLSLMAFKVIPLPVNDGGRRSPQVAILRKVRP